MTQSDLVAISPSMPGGCATQLSSRMAISQPVRAQPAVASRAR